MSGKGYRITEIARLDVEDIGRYTNKTWGKRQRNDYLRALFSRFEFLAEFPYSGQQHDHITAPCAIYGAQRFAVALYICCIIFSLNRVRFKELCSREGLFGFSEGAHMIFYRINADGIDILRVLHQRMSLEERL
ncbi:type II toxin-antitoxin system RelE/ParE family toxin [Agrobacterium vitis]|uniref:Type II toxin-antitoxin system RelE/ParE family toxin n=1 Tax=Agrobacterium vitis TaxID=373 RepID=A0AAE2RE58_AGRVI|nr:type II toxin-antitoxin system RelE/ParE family toxin [Agrobacterium vitis]MBF2715799.1 type II toxin-antitoxin system RelE/ParE family toxin [Agrobacterium vitis]MUZ65843.1 hypothetical protein [Agrobacterium vitis]MVA17349.1 hypothetical protein [Agrobacterium vitis]